MPSDRIPALLKWTHESSGHVGADHTLKLVQKWFTLRGVMTKYGKPSSLSWTSARAGPANLET